MKEILEIAKEFEKRNNISVSLTFHTDGSGNVSEFWDFETLFSFDDTESLKSFLKTTSYKLAEDGRCISPVQVV